jgi:HSP20 family protein
MKRLSRRQDSDQSMARTRDPFALMQEMLDWDPFRELSGRSRDRSFAPSFDVKETNDAYLFKADLPGVKEGDIEVSLTGNRLTVSGQREEEKRDEGDRYYAYERSYGSFSRSFTLPDGVDQDDVQADLKDGVLTLTVKKKPEVQAKRIPLTGKQSPNPATQH